MTEPRAKLGARVERLLDELCAGKTPLTIASRLSILGFFGPPDPRSNPLGQYLTAALGRYCEVRSADDGEPAVDLYHRTRQVAVLRVLLTGEAAAFALDYGRGHFPWLASIGAGGLDVPMDTPFGRTAAVRPFYDWGFLFASPDRGAGIMVSKAAAARRLSAEAQAQGRECGDYLWFGCTDGGWAVCCWELEDLSRVCEAVFQFPGYPKRPRSYLRLLLNALRHDYLAGLGADDLLPDDQVCLVGREKRTGSSGLCVVVCPGFRCHRVSETSYAAAVRQRGAGAPIWVGQLESLGEVECTPADLGL